MKLVVLFWIILIAFAFRLTVGQMTEVERTADRPGQQTQPKQPRLQGPQDGDEENNQKLAYQQTIVQTFIPPFPTWESQVQTGQRVPPPLPPLQLQPAKPTVTRFTGYRTAPSAWMMLADQGKQQLQMQPPPPPQPLPLQPQSQPKPIPHRRRMVRFRTYRVLPTKMVQTSYKTRPVQPMMASGVHSYRTSPVTPVLTAYRSIPASTPITAPAATVLLAHAPILQQSPPTVPAQPLPSVLLATKHPLQKQESIPLREFRSAPFMATTTGYRSTQPTILPILLSNGQSLVGQIKGDGGSQLQVDRKGQQYATSTIF